MINKPTKKEAEDAIKTLLSYIGQDINREGLKETPSRVIKAFDEYTAGYNMDYKQILSKSFSESESYDDMVSMTNIPFESMCEHHLAPFVGVAHISYIPSKNVVGISKLARLVDVFAKRLQLQERLNSQIANALDECLAPKGVAVQVIATHFCVKTRGVHKHGCVLNTTQFRGEFKKDTQLQNRFFQNISVLNK